MSFLNKYKTAKTAEVNGVWVEIDANVEIKVARLNNEKARARRRELEKPYRNFQTVPDHVSEDILRKVMSETVLLGWRTTSESGATTPTLDGVEYSPAAAEKLFKDFPDFLNDVVSLAVARETFQTEATEAVKNG